MFSFVLKSYSIIDYSATSESSVSLPAQLQSMTDGSEKSRRKTFERKIEHTQESYSQEHSAALNVGPSDLRQSPCPLDTSFLTSLKGQEKTDRLFDLFLGDVEMELSDINDIVDEKTWRYCQRVRASKHVWRHTGGSSTGLFRELSKSCKSLSSRTDSLVGARSRSQGNSFHDSMEKEQTGKTDGARSGDVMTRPCRAESVWRVDR